MANPFLAKFNSSCQAGCGRTVPAGESMYRTEGGLFACPDCATEAGNVCKCGGFKKEQYAKCYECMQKEKEDKPIEKEWDPWAEPAPKPSSDLPF